jgi:hypothetical protein
MIILNEVKIKYDHLDKLLSEKLVDIRLSNTVNVVVDLKEVFRKFFRPNVLSEEFATRNMIEELSSDVLGIIGHYRNYFYKKGKYTSFYFLYSRGECEVLRQKYPDYKKEYYQKYFYEPEYEQKIKVIKKSVEVADRVISHVPNATFIDTTKFDEFVVAKFLIKKTQPNELNIILSNDEMMMQLVNRHTFVLNMKGIKTKLIEPENVLAVITEKDTKVSVNLLPLILAIAGVDKYTLDNVHGMGTIKALRSVEHMISKGKLLDTEYVDFPVKLEQLDAKDRLEAPLIEAYEKLKSTYELIKSDDVLYTHPVDIAVLFNKTKPVYTWDYFLELNSKIFANHPISLEMMLKGESIKN